jgi:hypothetical protein
MEKHYVFIKDNRVVQIAVFESQNQELANTIMQEKGYDNAIWIEENPPAIHSFWDGTIFEEPTQEYLVSIGLVSDSVPMNPLDLITQPS